jgi:hypothetical protein
VPKSRNNYKTSIPWKVLENYLLLLRQHAFMDTLTADGLQAVGKCQGKAMAYNELLNLPETLELREIELEELNRDEEEQRGR